MAARKPPTQGALCGLGTLADERLPGVLPGLVVQGGWLEVDPKAFPCCQGTGSRLMAQAEVTVRCELSVRLRAVRTLYRRAAEQNAKMVAEMEDPLFHKVATSTLKRLRAIAKGETNRGLAFVAEADAGPAVSVWALALASAWRFGLRPHVVTLGRGPVAGDLFPKESGDGRTVLFVGGVSALWDATQADSLDALVGYAYRTLTPLFVELKLASAAPPSRAFGAGPSSTRSGFRARLAGVKSRSPLSWLTPECAAKIPDVVEGLGRFSQATGRAAASTRLPTSPKLPHGREPKV